MSTPGNLLPNAFSGTAAAYLRYRPAYPPVLMRSLLAHANVPPGGTLVDLACGPGRATLDLVETFGTIWAIDLEPEMIEVAQQEAGRRGIGGIRWLVGRAEDLSLAPNSVDLITIGEAFHRLDQSVVAARSLEWLRPGGCVATLGTEGILDGREPWQETVAEIARRWMHRAFPHGWAQGRAGAELSPDGAERVLRAVGFIDVESRVFLEPRDWSFEEVVGYLQSTSVCSKFALGDDFVHFEAELRAALVDERAPKRLREEMRCGYTIGRKPAATL